MVAKDNGRDAVQIELNPDYIELQKRRVGYGATEEIVTRKTISLPVIGSETGSVDAMTVPGDAPPVEAVEADVGENQTPNEPIDTNQTSQEPISGILQRIRRSKSL